MTKGSELTRHVVSVSALMLLIAGLAYLGHWSGSERLRPIAQLEDAAKGSNFVTEHRSAAQRPDESTQAAPTARHGTAGQPTKGAMGRNMGMAASAWKDWSKEEWQAAIKAAEEYRSTANAQPESGAEQEANNPVTEHRSASSSSKEPLVWQPPAEIAGGVGTARAR